MNLERWTDAQMGQKVTNDARLLGDFAEKPLSSGMWSQWWAKLQSGRCRDAGQQVPNFQKLWSEGNPA